MGQYYLAYTDGEQGAKVFCPQNAVYMTKNGLSSAKEIGSHGFRDDDPNSWGYNFSGLKLMEHSWLENAKLRDMCSELYRRYWDVEGDFFIDPEMGKLEKKLRELGIETWEAWE